MNAINAQATADYLIYLIEQGEEPWSDDGDKPSVCTFEQAGVMSLNAGLVLRPRWAGVPDERDQVPLRHDSQGRPFA